MPSIDEMMSDLQAADQAGDHELSNHIAGLIKRQQNGAIEGEPDLGQIGNPALAAGIGFVHNLPFVGDAAITAARAGNDMLSGRPTSWDQANQEAHQTIQSAHSGHPIASVVGDVGGAVDTGIVAGGALKAAGAGTTLLRSLPAATTTAQRLANVARVTAVAAGAGAAQGAAQGGGEELAGGHLAQVPGHAVRSALGGGAAGAVLGPLAAGAPAAGRVFSPLGTKAALALSRVMGESAPDIQAAWRTFQTTVGRAPTMAELASLKQAGQIKAAARDSSTISDALTTAQEDAARARSDNMQAVIAPTQPTAPANGQVALPAQPGASSGEINNATTAQADVDYPAARTHDFTIPTEDSPELGGISPSDHLASQIVPLAGLKTADKVRIVEGLKTGRLSGQDAQLLNSKLGQAQGVGSNYSPAIASAKEDLADFLAGPGNDQAYAALDQANANYVAGSQRAAGAAHGETILGADTAPNYAAEADSKLNANPNFTTGMASGARSKLADQAATPQGATSLAQRFATDDSLHAKLSKVFSPDVADSLRRLGQQETTAAQNLAPYANKTSAEDQGAKDAQVALRGLAAFASHGVYQIYHGYKAIQGLGMSPKVQALVAQYLSDPKMVRQGIEVLQKAGMTNAALRQMTLDVAHHVGVAGAGAENSISEGSQ